MLTANLDAFGKQAKNGAIYVEFDVPEKTLVPTNEGWAKIVGTDSIEGRLAKRKGLEVPEMPTAQNIAIKGEEINGEVRKKMLNKFEQWVIQQGDYILTHNKNELSNSAVVDFENENYIARFTVWDDFSCMSEVMDVNTGLYKLNKRNEFSTFYELLDIFDIFRMNIQ